MRSVLISVCVGMLASALAGSAGAATVVNGNFETGDLSGWNTQRQIGTGNWFAYDGTVAPIANKPKSKPVQPPPQGRFAAMADEAARESLILYQDVSLPPGAGQTLSLLAYYDSYKPLAVPTPDTLSAEFESLAGQSNQQFRIDVMDPAAPLESVDPADILRSVFATKPGGPMKMSPTRLTADLGAFAGQTVRLRIATVATDEVLNAGVDDISISGVGEAGAGAGSGKGGPGRNGAAAGLRIARVRTNGRNGTATLFVRVPGPGLVTAMEKAGHSGKAHRSRASRRGKAARRTIRAITVKARAAGVVGLRLKPTRLGRRILRRKHRLPVRVSVLYTSASGARQIAGRRVVLRLSGRLAHSSN